MSQKKLGKSVLGGGRSVGYIDKDLEEIRRLHQAELEELRAQEEMELQSKANMNAPMPQDSPPEEHDRLFGMNIPKKKKVE